MSSPAIANSTVYVGSLDGTLYAFRSAATNGLTPPDTLEIPEISVDPLTLDFGGKPVDYPPKSDDIIIENIGERPLIVESITLTDDGGGAFTIKGIYREGRLGALFPTESLPYELDPGKLMYVLVEFDDVDERADPFSGTLEIRSNDPYNSIVQVSLSGDGQCNSNTGTVITEQTEPSRTPGEEGRWVLPLEVDNGTITTTTVVDFFNLYEYDLELYEDAKGVTASGKLDCPNLPGQMLLEVWSKSSPERLTVYNILISPIEAEDGQGTPSLPIEILIVALVAILAVIGIVVYRILKKRK